MTEDAATDPARPTAPPDLRLRNPTPRVMRLSPKAMAVLGALLLAGVGGALTVGLKTADKKPLTELYNTDGHAAAEPVATGPKDYAQVPKLGPPLPGDLGRPILSAQQRGERVPTPGMGSTASVSSAPPNPRQPSASEIARQRAQQEREAARTSRLFLGGSTTAGASEADLPTLAGTGPAASDAATNGQNSRPVADQATKQGYLARQVGRPDASAARLTAPVSPYVVQAGAVIPAALVTAVRSDLPGQIVAQVTQNVYDSPTGRILLIPQGARLIGDYDSEVTFGQDRVLLAWNRLIFPDGHSILLDRQPGADAAGRAGLQDGVDHHWGRILRAGLVSTLLGVGAELGAGGEDDLTQALRRGTQDTLNQTGRQIVGRQLDVQPTLTLRPGHSLRVLVTQDLVLEAVLQENTR